jgi:phage tail sheath gpL-like
MPIANLLSLNFLVPYTAHKIDFSRAIRGLRGMPRRLLLTGHKLAAGTLAVNTLATITTEADAIERLGEGSMLLAMWRDAKANADLGLPIDVMAIAVNGTATVATSAVVVAGAPSLAGELPFYMGGERVSVACNTADTSATIATKLAAAINAVPRMPVTAAAVASTVTLTCKWGGPSGNEIDLRAAYYPDERLPTGVSLTIPAMAGGAGNPDVSPVIVGMSLYRATEIVNPFTDSANMVIFETELAARWLQNNMQDGMLITALRGTEAALTTYLNTRNSPHVTTITTTRDATSPWETAAMAGAALESSAAIDPAQGPTSRLVGYKGPTQGNHFTIDQINNLLLKGGSSLTVNIDYTANLLRLVQNYKLSSGGAPDRSMAETMWLKTMSYYRWFRVTEFQTKYTNQGYKLAQYVTEPIPGQKIMTVDLAKEIMIGLYKLFCDAGLCQNLAYYSQTLQVEIDAPNGKLKIIDEPIIVTQHYQTEISSSVIAGQI